MAKDTPASMPSDCRPIEAIDPVSGKMSQVYIRVSKMQDTARRGMGAARELAISVLEVLKAPLAIFRGVREEAESEWLCYSGIPSKAFDYKTGNGGPAWEGEVLLVFVTDEKIVYSWRWDVEDDAYPGRPVGFETRFQKVEL